MAHESDSNQDSLEERKRRAIDETLKALFRPAALHLLRVVYAWSNRFSGEVLYNSMIDDGEFLLQKWGNNPTVFASLTTDEEREWLAAFDMTPPDRISW